ncbi:MAG: serine/threonine-protein kinase [Chloroflexota bacterium]
MSQFPEIAGYQILDISGQGGMSKVYRARQLDTDREVALKLISSNKADWFNQFSREAEIIASLEHPHILPVYDFGTSENQPYLVMRLLEGGSLADWVRNGKRPDQNKVIQSITNIAEALDFSHARGILHRDVKPSNMLLDNNGFVYLSDFGLAVFPADGQRRGLGSAAYISPEQARGEDLDGRADIYSLSVSLFELLTGYKPYVADTPVAVMIKQINEPVPNAREFNPKIAPSIAELIQWGMSKKAENRPQTAGQFGQLLQYASRNPDAPVRPSERRPSSEQPIITVGSPEIETTKDRVARQNFYRWQVILLALLVLLMTFIATLIIWFIFANPFGSIANDPTPVSTSVEEPIASQVLEAPVNEKLIYQDRFETETLPGDLDDGVAFVGGALQIQLNTVETKLWTPDDQPIVADGRLDIELLQSSRATTYQIGLVCRLQPNGDFIGVYIEQANGLQSAVTIKVENQEQTFLDSVEIPEALQVTDLVTHRLGLQCVEDTIEFFIDDSLVLSSRDEAPREGAFGVLTTNFEERLHVVRFDNLIIEQP